MSVKLSGIYAGEFRTEVTHEPSGATILTDAPVDNGGKGSQFSPTDMLSASYATCMMTIMALRAEKKGLDVTGLAIGVTKHMTTTLPRKIARLEFAISLPESLTSEQKEWLMTEAKSCPVALSVHPDIELNFITR